MKHLHYNLSYYLALIENAEDQHKFEALYHRYRKQMYYLAKRYLNDNFLAEDAVHEAFCHIARNMDKFHDKTVDGSERFIMKITRNATIDVYRKRKQYLDREVYDDDDDENPNSFIERVAPTVEMDEESEFENEELLKAFEALSEDAKYVLKLKFDEGFDNREISEITGFSVAKIEKLICRSKKTLRCQMSNCSRGDN